MISFLSQESSVLLDQSANPECSMLCSIDNKKKGVIMACLILILIDCVSTVASLYENTEKEKRKGHAIYNFGFFNLMVGGAFG